MNRLVSLLLAIFSTLTFSHLVPGQQSFLQLSRPQIVSGLAAGVFFESVHQGKGASLFALVRDARLYSVIKIDPILGRTWKVIDNADTPLSLAVDRATNLLYLLFQREIRMYDSLGTLRKKINIANFETVLDIYVIERQLYCVTISHSALSETYQLISATREKKLFRHSRPKTDLPRRLRKLLVVATSNIIAACYDDSLNLYITSKHGRLINIGTNPKYSYKRYSAAELETFGPLKRWLAETYDPFPPVVQKLIVLSDDTIGVVRALRPFESSITIDLFSNRGDYGRSIVLSPPKGKQYVDLVGRNTELFLITKDSLNYFVSRVATLNPRNPVR